MQKKCSIKYYTLLQAYVAYSYLVLRYGYVKYKQDAILKVEIKNEQR